MDGSRGRSRPAIFTAELALREMRTASLLDVIDYPESGRQRCAGNAMRRGGMDDQALCLSRPYRAVNAVLHCPYLGSRCRRKHSGSPVFLGLGSFTLRPPVLV